MTDEEIAEAWLDERYLKNMGIRRTCKVAFLAGFKAGKDMVEADLATIAYVQGAERYRTKWHVCGEEYQESEKGTIKGVSYGNV